MRPARCIVLCLLVCIGSPAAAEEPDRTTRKWIFDVSLDGSPIGTQTFELTRVRNVERVAINAKFTVKRLFITVYTYRHQNVEVWSGDCLRNLDSTTDQNGEKTYVHGALGMGGFEIETVTGRRTLPACVASFPYWAPERLRAGSLLDAQDGTYGPMTFRELGDEEIRVRGKPTLARHIVIEDETRHFELWYDRASGDWVALETISPRQNIVRYALR